MKTKIISKAIFHSKTVSGQDRETGHDHFYLYMLINK